MCFFLLPVYSFLLLPHGIIQSVFKMSDSDEQEFFLQSQNEVVTGGKKSKKKKRESVIEYFFVVVFELNLNIKEPFQCYVLEIFQEVDIPSAWIKGPLEASHRVTERKFECFPDKTFYVFCKIEKGIFF